MRARVWSTDSTPETQEGRSKTAFDRIEEVRVANDWVGLEVTMNHDTPFGRGRVVVLCLLAGVPVSVAHARPDDGRGLFTYDASDVLAFVDSADGRVRVHYSVSGTNQTLLTDSDEDGTPDFPEQISEEVSAVLDVYEAEGFRRPVLESEVGLDALGGSDALDVYLVDFGGSSDGQFGVDRCQSGVCAGYLLIENDFAGYGYSSLSDAARVLASHELFHGVQFAYADEMDPWFSEGTATWAEHFYQPEINDYLRLCKAYLEDTGRTIDHPPAGTVTSFSYGTALFFGYVQETLGSGRMVEMLEEIADAGDGDELGAVIRTVESAGVAFSDAWVEFVTWNLATGRRSGILEGYPYAESLAPGIRAEAEGDAIVDDNRFYPLAATYYRIDHPGGELLLGVGEDNAGLVTFQVHAVVDGTADADIGPALLTWAPDLQGVQTLGDQPAGGYWLIGTYAISAAESEKRVFCFGGPDAMTDCAPAEVDDGEDTGTPDDSDVPEESDTRSTETTSDADKSGCSTVGAAGNVAGAWLALGLLGVWMRRSREG